MTPQALILRSAGVNCDEETAFAFRTAGADPREVHVNRLMENPRLLDDAAILALPGGFSYGDDLGAGRISGLELRVALGDAIRRLIGRGGLVLGICNGFQALVQSGLLPGPGQDGRPVPATLAANTSGRYEDRWVHLRVQGGLCRFVERDAVITLPVAHGEGRFVTADPAGATALLAAGRVVLRYVAPDGSEPGYPDDPNGSLLHIAGICDVTGQILGLMPHPERHLFPWHHPRFTREGLAAEGEGLSFFRAAVAACR